MDILIKPRYRILHYFRVIVFSVIAIGLISLIIIDRKIGVYDLAIIAILVFILFEYLRKFYRLFIFMSDRLVIERYLFAPKEFLYSGFLNISQVTITTSQGDIDLRYIRNYLEVIDEIEALVNSGKITEEVFDGSWPPYFHPLVLYAFFAFVIAGMIVIILLELVNFTNNLHKWYLLGILFTSIFLVLWIIRIAIMRNRAS